ncbi:MFS transporter [Natronococcus pandeyae]|uniref:MFS transporter n=1 Tax=Natronococcus pandeyae TaxID=2055836 RepID=A0A8J8Q2Z7_9EURY|nr:MFS transporter [Natronococcus pandeyae]TYL38446.1 MFS transporter [Natronococcus pandeyae]
MRGRVAERRTAYGLVTVATLSYTCLMFVWFSLPAYLSTIIAELELSGTQAGVVAGAVPLTYIPLALFSGLAVDRIGPGRSLAVGVVCYGLAQVGRSVATGFPSLLAFTLLIGVGATAVTFGLPKLVSVLFPADRTGLPSSIYLVGASAGTAAVFAIGRPTIGPWLGGWRPLFLWSGVVAIGYGFAWYLVARRLRVDERAAENDENERAGADERPNKNGTAGENGVDSELESIRRDLRLILTHRELQLVVVVGTMYLLASHGIQGWLPTVLESRGVSADRAGQTTGLFVAAYAVGIFAVPALADRYGARPAALMLCGGVFFVGVAGMTLAGSLGVVLLGSVVVAGIGVGGLSPLIRAIPPALEGIGSRLTGTAVGFIFAVGEIGGFLGPVLVGSLHDATGSYAPGLALIALAGLVVVLAGGALRRAAM